MAPGDVTDTGVVWKLKTHVGRYSSPLLVDGLIYMAAEESFISCFEAATGNVIWTERVGGKFAASPVYADGRLYFFSQEGKTTVLRTGRGLRIAWPRAHSRTGSWLRRPCPAAPFTCARGPICIGSEEGK